MPDVEVLHCWCCGRSEDQVKKDAIRPTSELHGPCRLMGLAAVQMGNICSDCKLEWYETGETDSEKIGAAVQKQAQAKRGT